MNHVKRSVVIGLLAAMLAPVSAFSGDTEDQAVEIAEEWLALVDQEKYEESWEEAAGLFKSAVSAQQWGQAMIGARKPLGDVNSRKLKMAEYTTSMPGAPDGEYVVIQFETSFANKESAIETITPMKDEDGAWRVAGYFIK